MRLHDCDPSMTDTQVLEFCKKGYLMLEGVVGDDINRRTVEYLETRGSEPSEILEQDWFMDSVILQPAAAGAVRSLLGRDFGLPVLVSNHRVTCPSPRQQWHRDGNSPHGPALKYLQVFYYPQDVPREMGPTEVLPSSHFLYTAGQLPQNYMGHYGAIRGSLYTTAPAGTIFLTVYSIWHRRSESTGSGVRNNLKYNYFRTAPPERDWIREDGFDFATADYGFGEPPYLPPAASGHHRQRGDVLLVVRQGGEISRPGRPGMAGAQLGWPCAHGATVWGAGGPGPVAPQYRRPRAPLLAHPHLSARSLWDCRWRANPTDSSRLRSRPSIAAASGRGRRGGRESGSPSVPV